MTDTRGPRIGTRPGSPTHGLLRPPDWTRDAACDQHPLGPQAWDNATPAARNICAGCPVRHDCATTALDNAIPTGLWGGLTPDDRHRIARGTYGHHGLYDPPGAARHGDRSRYNTCTAGPDGRKCDLCRESMRRWQASRRATLPRERASA